MSLHQVNINNRCVEESLPPKVQNNALPRQSSTKRTGLRGLELLYRTGILIRELLDDFT